MEASRQQHRQRGAGESKSEEDRLTRLHREACSDEISGGRRCGMGPDSRLPEQSSLSSSGSSTTQSRPATKTTRTVRVSAIATNGVQTSSATTAPTEHATSEVAREQTSAMKRKRKRPYLL